MTASCNATVSFGRHVRSRTASSARPRASPDSCSSLVVQLYPHVFSAHAQDRFALSHSPPPTTCHAQPFREVLSREINFADRRSPIGWSFQKAQQLNEFTLSISLSLDKPVRKVGFRVAPYFYVVDGSLRAFPRVPVPVSGKHPRTHPQNRFGRPSPEVRIH